MQLAAGDEEYIDDAVMGCTSPEDWHGLIGALRRLGAEPVNAEAKKRFLDAKSQILL